MTNNKQNIPELRFPEFEGEWKKQKIKDISVKVGSGKTPLGGETVYKNHGIPFIRSQNVINNKLKTDKTFISEEVHAEMKSSKVVSKDILLNITGGSIGRSCVVPDDFIEGNVNQHVCIIRLENNDPYFLQPLLSSWHGQKLIIQAQTGSGREGLNFESIKGFKINLPSLPEQQKIASFLTAVDDKITQLSKKAALLEQYKKGVMQRIFKVSELGFVGFKDDRMKGANRILKSNHPKNHNSDILRFKDDNGQVYPDWEEKKLGEVIEFFNTNSYSRSLLNYNNGSVKNIHYGDIHTKFKSNFDITQENVPYINENVDLSKIKSEQYCQIGDLIIADASEDYKDIGKAIEIVNLNDEKVVAGLHTYIARDKEQFAIGFKGYLFRSEYIRKQIMKLATGVSVLGISKGNLASMSIFIPCLEEQQKIASFLTSIDRKIEQVNTQLEKAKIWKKGLLQKMFV